MGDEADFLLDRALHGGGYRRKRVMYNSIPHSPNCRCAMTDGVNTHCAQNPPPIKEVKRLSVEQAFKKAVPFDVPSHIVCKRCQATGLHWGLKDGKPELREEGGWAHKCKKVEGVTLNLPNILDPQ